MLFSNRLMNKNDPYGQSPRHFRRIDTSVNRVDLPTDPGDQTVNIDSHRFHGRPGLEGIGTVASSKGEALILPAQGPSAASLSKTHGKVVSASEGEGLQVAHNFKAFPAPVGGSMPLRRSNRKVLYRDDFESKQDGMTVPGQGLAHEFRGRGVGRAEEALAVVRT
jgi:hypothetical protein